MYTSWTFPGLGRAVIWPCLARSGLIVRINRLENQNKAIMTAGRLLQDFAEAALGLPNTRKFIYNFIE